MNRDDARLEIKRNWRQLITSMTEPAKTKANGETSYICPLCGHGKNGDGLTFNPQSKNHGLKCFGCDFDGDIIDLYQRANNADYKQAFNALAGMAKIWLDEPEEYKVSPHASKADKMSSLQKTAEEKAVTPEPADYLDYYQQCFSKRSDPAAVSYLQARGISQETAAVHFIGYDPNWISPTAKRRGSNPPASPRLIIPVTPNYYIARDTRSGLTDTQKPYAKMNEGSPDIFNKRALYEAQEVFITEGAIDALSIVEAGAQAIALNSTSNADKLIKQLEGNPTSATLILTLDKDEAGQKATQTLAEGLTRLNISYIKADITGGAKDPNEALQKDRKGFTAAVKKAQLQTAAKPDAINLYIDHYMTADLAKFKDVIYTGFDNLDKQAGGLYGGLYCIAAISSLGKTTFAAQMADQIAANGNDVIFFSLEQSRLEIVSKSIARITTKTNPDTAVTSLKIRRGYLPKHVIAAAEEYKRTVADRVSIVEGNFNCDIAYISNYLRRYTERNKCRPVVIIDYLQILQGEPSRFKQSTKEVVDSTVTELKRLSRELDLTIFIVSSVNRANYQTPIDFESLKESGGIEYTCDVVWGLQFQCLNDSLFDKQNNITARRERIQKAKKATPRKIELRCLKNRYGIANFSCYFNYYPANDLFTICKETDLDFEVPGGAVYV